MPPSIEASLRATIVYDALAIAENSILVPDVVNGKFISPYASVTLSNFGKDWITVLDVTAISSDLDRTTASYLRIAPGQSRPVSFILDDSFPDLLLDYSSFCDLPTRGMIQYFSAGKDNNYLNFIIDITQRNRHEPQKFTFLHPSGAVSYAILRPPSKVVCDQSQEELPVLLALHGAGLEADSYQVRHSFDAVPDLPAWLLFPTGMSPWSGDDWHIWGLSDVEAALSAVLDWVSANKWVGPGAKIDRYAVCGHSNGGQGAWHLAMHQPDRVIAAAVASGYTSIENYVPYVMWGVNDPRLDALLHSARIAYKHELFFPNVADKPILIQHGQDDDNVPAYHGRLMKSLASQNKANVKYAELTNKGHWWDEAMVTAEMLDFYDRYVTLRGGSPQVPERFSCVVASSDDFGSCRGIFVDQLSRPESLARLRISTSHAVNYTTWHVVTSNIHCFHVDFWVANYSLPDAVRIDHGSTVFELDTSGKNSFRLGDAGVWVRDGRRDWQRLGERTGRQRGSMDAMLRSHGPFSIVYDSPMAFDVGLQISRNTLQYFGADADLCPLSEYDLALEDPGNVIVLAVGPGLPHSKLNGFPIKEKDGVIFIRVKGHSEYRPVHEATGAAFLRPLYEEALELVVWGCDEAGLRQAARMVPTLTGVGQPDFVIFDKSATGEGVGGVLAAGFFDYSWNISAASYLPF